MHRHPHPPPHPFHHVMKMMSLHELEISATILLIIGMASERLSTTQTAIADFISSLHPSVMDDNESFKSAIINNKPHYLPTPADSISGADTISRLNSRRRSLSDLSTLSTNTYFPTNLLNRRASLEISSSADSNVIFDEVSHNQFLIGINMFWSFYLFLFQARRA